MFGPIVRLLKERRTDALLLLLLLLLSLVERLEEEELVDRPMADEADDERATNLLSVIIRGE